MPDDDDRPSSSAGNPRPDGSHAADATWAELVIPDDLRGLARDVAAYHREVRRNARARRLRRLLRRRAAVPLLALTVAALLAGVVASLLTVMAPHALTPPPASARLAKTHQQPGQIGGLLPETTLAGPNGYAVDSHSPTLRPALLALVPAQCDCRDVLNGLAGAALSENLRLKIVVPAASDPAVAAIAAALERGPEAVYYDANATLATSVAARGVTAVLVSGDGTIYDVVPAITDPTRTSIDAELQSMLLPERS